MNETKITNQQILAAIKPIRTAVKGHKFLEHITQDERRSHSRPLAKALNVVEDAIPKLTLDDLVGKSIQEHRRIENIDPYNPDGCSPNPKYLHAMLYDDGSIVVVEEIGLHDDHEQHWYYVNERTYKHSDRLFNGSGF